MYDGDELVGGGVFVLVTVLGNRAIVQINNGAFPARDQPSQDDGRVAIFSRAAKNSDGCHECKILARFMAASQT